MFCFLWSFVIFSSHFEGFDLLYETGGRLAPLNKENYLKHMPSGCLFKHRSWVWDTHVTSFLIWKPIAWAQESESMPNGGTMPKVPNVFLTQAKHWIDILGTVSKSEIHATQMIWNKKASELILRCSSKWPSRCKKYTRVCILIIPWVQVASLAQW